MKKQLALREGTIPSEVTPPNAVAVHFTALAERLEADGYLRRALSVPGTAILGVDGEGVPLLLRLCSPDITHCVITGNAGSGKTELARTLVASLAREQRPRDLRLALFDPKGYGLAPFALCPHLLFPVTRDPSTVLERMQTLIAEMERRQGEQTSHPRIIVVFDDVADLLQICGREVEQLLTRLVGCGKDVGMSVVACAQKPPAALLAGLNAEMLVRLVGRATSVDEARDTAGMEGTGAERLRGQGSFVLVAGGEAIRFQAAYIRAEEWPTLVERIVSNSRLGERRIIPFRIRERVGNYEP